MSKPRKILLITFIFICSLLVGVYLVNKARQYKKAAFSTKKIMTTSSLSAINTQQSLNPLAIQSMREKSYPGSDIRIEQTLPDGKNYNQYLTSYMSDGLKIYALLTVPISDPQTGNQVKPKNGWPVIVFNHGYIAPRVYQTFPTAGQYATYYPMFAKNGYIVFKPDYRGNGNSEGTPEGAYYSPAYAVDDLNALASIKKYKDSDPNRIGVWGHSMGGNITLRDLVIDSQDIKAAVIWGGVVGTYNQLLNWHDPNYNPSAYELTLRNKYRADLIKQYGTPQQNPAFWKSIDPTYFIKDVTTPIQLDVGGSDEEVPPAFSLTLRDKLLQAGKTVEYYEYPGSNHNITQNFDEAMRKSLVFFNKYLK